MSAKVAVLLPCYNESLTIAKVVQDFRNVLPEAKIYVYDNNSTDGSADLAERAGAVVRKVGQQGKGHVVRRMFQEIDADCYVMVDSDDTYPADEVHLLVDPILDGSVDMVIGDRLSSTYLSENKRQFHGFGNKLVRFLINKMFRCEIHDVMTGYRSFNRLFVKNCPVLSGGFEIETEMTLFACDKRMALREVPITYRDRPDGSYSKLNTFSDGIKVLMTIFNMFRNYRPMMFFTGVAVTLFALASIAMVPVLIDYVKTGEVPRYPTLIVACFTYTGGLLSLVCGLILDSIFCGANLLEWIGPQNKMAAFWSIFFAGALSVGIVILWRRGDSFPMLASWVSLFSAFALILLIVKVVYLFRTFTFLWLSDLSYEIYLVHCVFIERTVFPFRAAIGNDFLWSLAYFAFSLVAAFALAKASRFWFVKMKRQLMMTGLTGKNCR